MALVDVELAQKQVDFRNDLVKATMDTVLKHQCGVSLRVECTANKRKLWDYPNRIPLKVAQRDTGVHTHMRLNLVRVIKFEHHQKYVSVFYQHEHEQKRLDIPYIYITGVEPLSQQDSRIDARNLDAFAFAMFAAVPSAVVLATK